MVKRDGITNIKSYELSLFGVMLALSIIRNKDRDRLKHDLHYQQLSFADYYDNIARNYKNKLPLIFGKWTLLNDILKSYSVYNFDFILDSNRQLTDSCERSLIRGGIKELVESLREMVHQNHYQFLKLHYDGEQAKRDYLMKYNIDIQSQVDRNKTLGLTKKMDEIMILLNPLDQISLSDANIIRKISIQFEQQFKREITTLYYIHLCSYLFDFELPTTEQWLRTSPQITI